MVQADNAMDDVKIEIEDKTKKDKKGDLKIEL